MSAATAITFDVYGTLAQWDEMVTVAIGKLLTRHDRNDDNGHLAADAFEAESREFQTVGAFRSYRDILRDSLVPALATAAIKPSD